jgi:hypothetical protein
MGFPNIFKTYTGGQVVTDLASPYKLQVDEKIFIDFNTSLLYQKILKRCYAKSLNFPEEAALNLWDSVELSNAQHGTISLISDAMTKKQELILVNDAGIVRVATSEEAQEIKKDYADGKTSKKGVYMNFQKYTMTDIIKVYMSLIYDIMGGAKTNLGLTKALQIKIADLRKTIATSSSEDTVSQAKAIAGALKDGKSVGIDAGDSIVTTELQTQPIIDGLKLVYGCLASILGVSTSFICGELTSGMAVTGEADVNANEDGIKDFFNSVFKPIHDKLFDIKLKFKSDNWRKIKEFSSIIPYIESSMYLDEGKKKELINGIFGVDK